MDDDGKWPWGCPEPSERDRELRFQENPPTVLVYTKTEFVVCLFGLLSVINVFSFCRERSSGKNRLGQGHLIYSSLSYLSVHFCAVLLCVQYGVLRSILGFLLTT